MLLPRPKVGHAGLSYRPQRTLTLLLGCVPTNSVHFEGDDAWGLCCDATIRGASVIEQQSWEVKRRFSSPLLITDVVQEVTVRGTPRSHQVG